MNHRVRYLSPFGSPVVMRRRFAEAALKADDALWLRLGAIGALSDHQRHYGAPRIEEVH